MPTEEELDAMRVRFERARLFDDDDDWFVTTPKTSRDPTPVTTAIKRKKPAMNRAVKESAVEAAKIVPMSTTKPIQVQATKMKFEPSVFWEPRGLVEQTQMYAPGVMAGYDESEMGEVAVDGWRIDEYGRPVRVVEQDVREMREREGLVEMALERAQRSEHHVPLLGTHYGN